MLGVCTTVLGWPLALGLLPAIATLGGAYLLFRPGRTAKASPGTDRDGDFAMLIGESRTHLANLRKIAADPHSAAIRSPLNATCATADLIVGQMLSDASASLVRANSLETTLAQAETVLTRYLELLGGTLVVDEARDKELRQKIESEFLPAIAAALREFARRLDEGDVIDLEASIHSTMTRLKLEGL